MPSEAGGFHLPTVYRLNAGAYDFGYIGRAVK